MALGKSRCVRFEQFGVCENGGNPEKQKGLLAFESENCVTGNALKRGVGVRLKYRADGSSYGIDNTTQKADYYFSLCVNGEEKIGFVTKTGLLFLDDGKKPLSRHDFATRTGGVLVYDEHHAEKMAFASDNGVWVYDMDGGAVKTDVENASKVLCFFKERLFCVEKPVTLVYSEPAQPNEFASSIDGAGKLVLPTSRGEIVALAPVKEKLYIFYEYGISALHSFGSGKDFRVEEIPYHGARIYGESVGACFDKIYFLTQTGLCVLDGDGVSSVCENLAITPKTSDQVCAHAQANGQYYLRYTDEKNGLCGVVVDCESGAGYRAFAMDGLSLCKGESVCFANAGFCKIENGADLPVSATAYFTANNIDFDSAGVKTLKYLRVYGAGKVRVQVRAGNRTRTADLQMQDGFAQGYIGVRGKAFELKIELVKGAEITAIEAEVVE